MKDYQYRHKFFYAVPELFPEWPYPSRLAIGVKLSDAFYRKSPVFRFNVRGQFYEMKKAKANRLGKKFTLGGGALPNILPLEEFRQVKPTDYISEKTGIERKKRNEFEFGIKEKERFSQTTLWG